MARKVYVEIVAKKKGCMLCDLALAILEEIAPDFEPGVLTWEVVDVGAKEGLERQEELARLCGRKPAVPSIVINERIAFDHIPEMGDLTEAVQQAWKEVSSR
jgi:glutaredoxin